MTNAKIKEMETVITENFEDLKESIFRAHAMADTLDNAIYFADQRTDKDVIASAAKVAELLAGMLDVVSEKIEEAEHRILEAVETEEMTKERICKELNIGYSKEEMTAPADLMK